MRFSVAATLFSILLFSWLPFPKFSFGVRPFFFPKCTTGASLGYGRGESCVHVTEPFLFFDLTYTPHFSSYCFAIAFTTPSFQNPHLFRDCSVANFMLSPLLLINFRHRFPRSPHVWQPSPPPFLSFSSFSCFCLRDLQKPPVGPFSFFLFFLITCPGSLLRLFTEAAFLLCSGTR